jgi:head-tail adaptor
MRNGKRKCPVTIQRATITKSATTNANVRVWNTLHDCWADAVPRRGLEVPVDGQIMANSYIRFDFAFLDVEDVVETDRILFNGNIYGIKGILPDIAGKEYITIDTALERPPG